MFALWYGVLTYREYRCYLGKIFFKEASDSCCEGDSRGVPLAAEKTRTLQIPLVEPPKPPRTPSPIPPRSPSPRTPDSSFSPPQASSTPIKGSPDTTKPLDPPPKPPRAPSPHPIRAEAFEDIEYEEEEEEEESSDVEDDENSVISSSSPRRAPISNSVNEFINQEINQPNSLRLNQTR
ncbi:hypothetical protein NQ318_003491 [Aromia moschata]|uniref:Uncharacterized protein n=1 Tax=Aromia moschata TaxID=1265417 RepID=A0AAV8YXA0_9CUCU|nr:hypothetical protein NQ318_003491 [Aromia moschata]